MKTKICLIISLIFALVSCEIRGPEEKPDYTHAGKQVFIYSEENLNRICDLFDIALRLNTYIETPDSLKPDVRSKHLADYSVQHLSDSLTWNLSSGMNIAYQIKTDSKLLTTEGAVWTLKSYGIDSCSVHCIAKNKWQFALSNSMYYYMDTYADLQFNCTDSLSPVDYYSSDYLIEGTSDFQLENYAQNIFINSTTENVLEHKANSNFNFSGGSLILSAHELEDANDHIVLVEYNYVAGDKRSITIKYEGKTHTYTDL